MHTSISDSRSILRTRNLRRCDTDKQLVERCCTTKALNLVQSDNTCAREGALASGVW